jgi:hypothetical protein
MNGYALRFSTRIYFLDKDKEKNVEIDYAKINKF